MHPDHTNATVEDLWPGDFIVARSPGNYYPAPHRFVDTVKVDGHLYLTLSNAEGSYQFTTYAPCGWKTRVKRV